MRASVCIRQVNNNSQVNNVCSLLKVLSWEKSLVSFFILFLSGHNKPVCDTNETDKSDTYFNTTLIAAWETLKTASLTTIMLNNHNNIKYYLKYIID